MLNLRVTTGHSGAQAQEEPAGWKALVPFLSRITDRFCETELKFLNSRVPAGGFVMRCAKKSWFKKSG